MSAARHGRQEPAAAPSARRLVFLVTVVSLSAAALLFVATLTLTTSGFGLETWVSLAALLVAAVFVEAYPVPIKNVRAGGISLAAIFIVATACLYGWGAAALLGALTRGVVEIVQRRPLMRLAYNSAVYAISAAVAGAVAGLGIERGSSVGWFALQVIVSSATFYALNVVLVALVVSIASGQNLGVIVVDTVESTAVAFATMASVAIMLCSIWQRSPLLAATLVGPFLAISLYQRSVFRELQAMELALTDPISGLGNHRHFQQELERLLDEVDETGVPLTLCLLDVDEFKAINDAHGHPVGDRILALVGEHLRPVGSAFRLGGDEFAIFVRTSSDAEAVELAAGAVGRISRARTERGVSIAVSAGLATYPSAGLARVDLVRAADSALYLAKAEGRAAVRVYRPGVVDLTARRGAEAADRRARLRAAASLAGAIDVRDASTGSRSHAVGQLAARLGEQLGLLAEEVELVRIAGLLHDLGKVAVPEHILSKPGPLNEEEHDAIAMHPVVGYRMLLPLRIEPVATWVLHHHERWDGSGYPTGLAGELIPIGSRILLVADAYEAMTTDRPYRRTRSSEESIEEIARNAGTQFDPQVVGALVEIMRAGATSPVGAVLAS